MGRKPQIEAFAAWSKERGLVTRDIDRQRVLNDLLDLTDKKPIAEEHVEALTKRYREGLVGSRAVLAARQIGLEILEWQEDGGLATFNDSHDVAVPAPTAAPEADPNGSKASIAPRATPSTSPKERSWEELFGKDEGAVRDPLEVDKHTSVRPTGYAHRSQPAPPQTGLVVEQSVVGVSEAKLSQARLDQTPIDGATGFASSRPPKPDNSPSESARPPGLGSLSSRPGSIRPASVRPPESFSERPPARPIPQEQIVPEPARPALRPGRRAAIGAGVLVALGLLSFLTKFPQFIYAAPARVVSGHFSSNHLGVQWEFTGSWKHNEQLDDTEGVPDGKRRVSVFFRGDSSSNFSELLTVVTIEGKTPIGAESARQLGANETMGMVQFRRCDPLKTTMAEGIRCSALGSHIGQPVAVLEYFYSLGGKAIFFRYFLTAPAFIPNGSVQDLEQQQANHAARIDDMIGAAEKMVSTMRPR
jgi:hypothetical protein